MAYRRDENIYQLTHRLRQSHTRSMVRHATWMTAAAGLYLVWAVSNGYWKATTGHTWVECVLMHPAGCDGQSMKLHGE